MKILEITQFVEFFSFNKIGDDVLRYKYNYLDIVRAGTNLAVNPKDVYKVPFAMNGNQYELSFHIGHNNHLCLLEDFDKKGEILIPLNTEKFKSATISQ